METLDSVVIGAGQAGLAASYFLRQRGIGHVVLDGNPEPGGAWQHRWASLSMADVHGVADLPGTPAPAGSRRAANVVVPDYFGDYERDQGLPVVRPVRVDRVDSEGDLLVVRAGEREWRTRTLVNATGTWTRPFVPFYPGIGSFAGEQVHTAHYPGAEHFRGRRVLVVGGGASAVQFLGELAPVTETLWVTRRPPVWREEFDAAAGLAAVTLVEERVRRGLPPASVVSVTGLGLRPQEQEAARLGAYERLPMFERIEADGVRWADPSTAGRALSRTSTRSSGPPASGRPSTTSHRSACARPRAGSPSSRSAATCRERPPPCATRACSWSATGRRPAPSVHPGPGARRRWPCPGSWQPRSPRLRADDCHGTTPRRLARLGPWGRSRTARTIRR